MAKVILDTDTGEVTNISGLQNQTNIDFSNSADWFGVFYNQAYNAMVQQAFKAWMDCWNSMFK